MTKLIHLDIAALLILVIILISQFTRRMSKGTTNHFFIALVIMTILSGAADIWAVVLDNAGSLNLGLRTAAHTLYLLAYNTISPLFLMYVISLTSTWEKITSNKAAACALTLPYLGVIGLLVSNLFTHSIFTFVDGVYTTMPLSFLPYTMARINILISIAYIIIYRRLFTARKLIALIMLLPVTVCILISKIIFTDTMVMVFGNTVGVVIIAVMIQRPENLIDSFTGLCKHSAYADDMKKNFAIRNHVSIVMVNIANYDSLQKILGYDKTQKLLMMTGKKILEQNRTAKTHGVAYYLDRGRFRLVINTYNRINSEYAASLINDALHQTVKIDKFDLNLIPYVCLAKCPEDIDNFQSLISFGTDFHEKLPYNGEVIHADGSTVKRMVSLLTGMDSIIERALANHGFHVYYQPIYSIEKKRFVSAEALLRLIDEKEGFISPEIFIPAAEKSGAIHKIGDYVLTEVFQFIASSEYKKLGLEYIEINLSVSQCMHHGLADSILESMSRYGVSSNQVNLEITESAASYDQSVMSENLEQLSAAGLTFSLDDYGTGYSNMYRIAALPLKIVKLDKTFVNNQNSKMWTILQNTVRMIKDLNMEIVVEGIETEEMVKKFSDLKCDFIQGYFFSKPIPQREFVEFIDRWNNRQNVNA